MSRDLEAGMSLRSLREGEMSSLAGWGREGRRRVWKGSLWRISQQVCAKQFPRPSCLPKPPIFSEEGPGCSANMARIFLAPSSSPFQKRTCLMKASPLAHLTRAGILKQFLIFVAPCLQPDVTPGVQRLLIGNERKLIDLAAPQPAHVAVIRWRK